MAPTLIAAIERWDDGRGAAARAFRRRSSPARSTACRSTRAAAHAPLPRAPQWIDGSVFQNHGRLMAQALHPGRENSYEEYPLVYQGASDDFIGPCDDVVVAGRGRGDRLRGRGRGDRRRGADADPRRGRGAARQAAPALQRRQPARLRRARARHGFGFFNAKPSSAFSPVAVTPDELGDAWREGRFELPLHVHWNGEWFGSPNAREMTFTFHQLIEHVTRSRRLRAGTIVGSGTVSNEDRAAGSACIAERTGDRADRAGRAADGVHALRRPVRIEMLDAAGASIFGAIDQRIVALDGRPRGRSPRRDPHAQARPKPGGEGRGERRGAARRSRRSSRTSPSAATTPSGTTRRRSTAGAPPSFRLSDDEVAACVEAVPARTLDDIRFAQEPDPRFCARAAGRALGRRGRDAARRRARASQHPCRERRLLRPRRAVPDGRVGAHERRHCEGRRRAARRRLRAARSTGAPAPGDRRRDAPRRGRRDPRARRRPGGGRDGARDRERRRRSTCSSAPGTPTSPRRSASSSAGSGSTCSPGRPRR